MDIRNFFGVKQNGKGKRKHGDDADDFVSTEKRKRGLTKPTKLKKSNIIYDSDSDEDVKPTKSKARTKSGDTAKEKKMLPTPSPTRTKPTTVLDFFGSSPVQRSAKKSPKLKSHQSNGDGRAKRPRMDLEEHDDVDFQETLRMHDDVNSPPAESKPGKRVGLASKLAARVKAETLVPETPDRRASPHRDAKRHREAVVEDTPAGSRRQSRVHREEETKSRSSPVKREFSTPKSTPSKVTKPETRVTPSRPTRKAAAHPAATTPRAGEVNSPPKGKAETKTSPTPADGEKKRGNPSYRSYLSREGPRSLGAREVPQGADRSLQGLTFVITGVLECFDKDEVKGFVEKYGGRVTGSISKKTTHLVIGRDPGESKVAKAQSCGTKQIQEEELYELIESTKGKEKSKVEGQGSKESAKQEAKKPARSLSNLDKAPKSNSQEAVVKKELSTSPAASASSSAQRSRSSGASPPGTGPTGRSSQMWVDRYKPVSTKGIIGQQGAKSNAKKLTTWLTRWHSNVFGKNKEKAKFNRDDGFAFRAALLSGPPGVGKTTTAQLVCQETGHSYIELNASDSRSKKKLQGLVSEYIDNQSISDMWKKGTEKEKDKGEGRHKHCLIMDEVDGVAGNEDRGGIQELIQMIKQTHIPIICICNDRSHPKIRSLVHHCFDLRFQRPRVPQIKAAMLSIAFKEGLSIPPTSLDSVILAANQDVRQVLHNLSMWSAGQTKLSSDQIETDAKKAQKDLKLGPWDVVRQAFSAKDLRNMSFIEKMDLFFHDYSIAPLFVQENYLSVVPERAKGDIKKHLDLISKAADSLCLSDLVEKSIRSGRHWRLLPTQAVFASVIPGHVLQGYMGHMISFPGWLGKNSTRGKNHRLLQELQVHMRKSTSASVRDLNQEYLPQLRRLLTDPLVEREADGVSDVVQLMCDYDLLREDFDSLLEVTQYPGFKEPMSVVAPKVKAAFTRAYNKESGAMPYAVETGKKKKGRGAGGVGPGTEAGLLGEEGEEGAPQEEEEEGSDNDEAVKGMMKVRKRSAKTVAVDSGGKGRGSKGKGPMKGKAQPKGRGRSK